MLASFTAGAQEYPQGDVNQDGAVNISDVTCLIDNLLAGVPDGDTNQDGVANISDVTSLIDYLLSGSWPDEPVTPPDDGDWVDLGLPSGTIWATRNVGATAPEDYGDYFAWGETAPKDNYEWSTYKWGNSTWLTKYCTDSRYGYVDSLMVLGPEDDAACAHYPGGRTPSKEQIIELCNNCTWQWTQRNGVNGQLGTGPNGNTIFLPAAGCRWKELLIYVGTYGIYWSRTTYPDYSYGAYNLGFDSGDVSMGGDDRLVGLTVRAVRASN